jgi:hypothetical protein
VDPEVAVSSSPATDLPTDTTDTTGPSVLRHGPLLPLLGLALLASGVLAMGALQLLPPTSAINPIRRTISEYALSSNKWLFDLSVVLVALGSATAFYTLVRRSLLRLLSVASVLGMLWIVSLLVIVAFPKTDWSVGPSIGGTVHRVASIVAFLCLPVAVIVAARMAFRHDALWRRLVIGLGILSLLSFTPILGAVLQMAAGGVPWWRAIPLGLVERFLAFSEVLAVGTLAAGLLRSPAAAPVQELEPPAPARTSL